MRSLKLKDLTIEQVIHLMSNVFRASERIEIDLKHLDVSDYKAIKKALLEGEEKKSICIINASEISYILDYKL